MACRLRAKDTWLIVAEKSSRPIGSLCLSRQGSVAALGPVTVHPDFWGKGISHRLMREGIKQLDSWPVTSTGLFTFAHSIQHVSLYQKYGFWPGNLVSVLSKVPSTETATGIAEYRLTGQTSDRRIKLITACRTLTETVYPGWDATELIRSTLDTCSGDCLVLQKNQTIESFALLYYGPGSEGGGGQCLVKLAVSAPGPEASDRFQRLLHAIETVARAESLPRVTLSVDTANLTAYRHVLNAGYRPVIQGISMFRNAEGAFSREEHYILTDWR